MVLKIFKNAWLDAWSMLIEFPFPFLSRREELDAVKTESTVILTQLLFPVAGVFCALLALALGTLLGKFFNPVPAAAVFAGVLTYFCVRKDDGCGLSGIMLLFSYKQKEVPFEQVLLNLPENMRDLNSPAANLAMILIVIFKLFAFSLMALYGYIYWLTAVLALEFAIEADLAVLPSLENGQARLKIKKRKQSFVWLVAGFLVLFVLFKAPVASLVLFGAAFCFSYVAKTYCYSRFNGVDSRIISLAAYVFELFALLLGMLLLTQGQVILL